MSGLLRRLQLKIDLICPDGREASKRIFRGPGLVRLKLQKFIFAQYVLQGRRTFLYDAQATPVVSKNGLIVKFSYQASTRTPEQDLVAIARKAGVKHLPWIHMWGDLWKLSDSTRQVFLEKSGGTAEYEDRTLRAIVYARYSPVKTLFVERCDLIPVMVDQMLDCGFYIFVRIHAFDILLIFTGLHDLRYKANILHRDISVNNIMYEMHGDKYYFILIDYDMGVVLPTGSNSSYKVSSKYRTGTLPFMACVLIEDASLALRPGSYWTHIRHLLCHDYESLFWVSLWCPLVLPMPGLTEDQVETLRDEALSWEMGTLKTVHSVKTALILGGLAKLPPLPPATLCLRKWFNEWFKLLYRSRNELITHEQVVFDRKLYGEDPDSTPWDAETINGTLSRDAIKAAITPWMPFRQSDDDDEEWEEAADLPEPA